MRFQNTPADQIELHQHDLAAAVAAARRGRTDVAVVSRVVQGDPRDHVVAESINAAAVVVGRPHQHGTTGWLRSVAHAVIKRTHCPLVVVPAE